MKEIGTDCFALFNFQSTGAHCTGRIRAAHYQLAAHSAPSPPIGHCSLEGGEGVLPDIVSAGARLDREKLVDIWQLDLAEINT